MKKRFEKAVTESTEKRALFVLLVVFFLRAWRALPNLRPVQLLIPATFAQILVFIFAALHRENFLVILAIGNFIIVGIAFFPSTLQKPKPAVHWIKNE